MEVANDDKGTTNKERPKRSIQDPLHFKDFQLYMIKPKLKSFTDQEQLSLFFVVYPQVKIPQETWKEFQSMSCREFQLRITRS